MKLCSVGWKEKVAMVAKAMEEEGEWRLRGRGKEEGEETEGREGHRGRQIDYELSYSDALPSCLKLGHEASCGVGV